ncbi:hypothetical protein K438DRAFT_1953704 [Mycena galopus ATCC 62051]|nr:hypothetical protein K438DRAFT_1953704 [Mycena galopus ATCC 62051]
MSSSESLHSCPKCLLVFSASDLDLPHPNLTESPRDILETNDPPSESEIPVLREFVSKARVRAAALDAKIALLQSSLELLLKEKHELDAKISMHRGGLSLLRRMPTEIMSHIFVFTLPPHQPYATSAPWTISAVCARWWEITISQPSFWTSISYDPDRTHSPMRYNSYEIQLRRSGQSPLNVKFASSDEFIVEDERRILQIICKEAGRWETVSFSGPDELYEDIGLFIQDQLAHLRKLTIEKWYTHEDTPLDIFGDAPQLHTVSVNREAWAYPVTMTLPWSQLVGYGGSNTWDGHLDALQLASNLVDCSLEIQGTSFLTETPLTPIILPRLLRLSLSDPRFLGCLETPALLELYCAYNALRVLSFLRRQTCKLQKLVIWRSPVPVAPVDLTRIVEAVPTISRLALLFSLPVEFSQNLRARLTMAPALEYFTSFLDNHSVVEETHSVEEVQDHAMDAIESRWPGGRLKSVKLYSLGTNLSRIHDRLEILRAQGMECAVLHKPHYRLLSYLDDIPPEHLILSTDERV